MKGSVILNNLICPISAEQVNKTIVRLTGFLVASLVVLFVVTLQPLIIVLLAVDFTVRGFSLFRFSPLSFIACVIAYVFKLKPKMIDKAPKLFAARVGLIFSLVALGMFMVSVNASSVILLVLMSFALLESLFDFCVGCVVYTYIVLPIHKKQLSKRP